MVIDISVLLLVLLFGFFGYRSGFLVQLTRILALVAGIAAAWVLTPPISEFIANGLAIDPFLAGVATFIALFFLTSLAIGLLGGSLAKAARSESAAYTFFDRGLGGLLGAAKGIVGVYVALALAWTLQPAIQKARPDFDMGLETSLIASEVNKHNVVQQELFPRAAAALKLLRLTEDPELMRRAQADPLLREKVLSKPDAQALTDPRVLGAPPDHRWKALVEDGRILDLLDDPDVVRTLADFDLEALRGTASEDGPPTEENPIRPTPETAPSTDLPNTTPPVEAPAQ